MNENRELWFLPVGVELRILIAAFILANLALGVVSAAMGDWLWSGAAIFAAVLLTLSGWKTLRGAKKRQG